jgi:hypothetical protein
MERRFEKGATGNYDIRSFDDPWKAMSPEDHKEANRLFRRAMRAPAGSQIQDEFRKKLEALLKKYGIGEKNKPKVVGEETRGMTKEKAIQLVIDMLDDDSDEGKGKEQTKKYKEQTKKYMELRRWCDKNGFDIRDVEKWAAEKLKKSIFAMMSKTA